MKLEKGQRWKIKATGAIFEVIDPVLYECEIKDKARGSYPVGNRAIYSISLKEAIDHYNIKTEDRYLEYLEGQDAPV
jgi:hypothetical protein